MWGTQVQRMQNVGGGNTKRKWKKIGKGMDKNTKLYDDSHFSLGKHERAEAVDANGEAPSRKKVGISLSKVKPGGMVTEVGVTQPRQAQ